MRRAEWLDLHKLRVFTAAAEHQHFSRAAAALRISQPAVSSHVKDLERRLGVGLFERTGRDVRLTDAGRLVDRYARRMLDLALELEEAVDETRKGAASRLVIGASTTPTYLLPPLLSSLRERHPEIDVAVEIGNTSAIVDRVLRGDLHLGLVGGPATEPGLEFEPWVKDELVLILPVGHRWAGRVIDPAWLGDEPFVAREEGSATVALMRGALERAGVRMRPNLVLGNTEAVKAAVAGGLGISFVSAGAVALELGAGRLEQCTVRSLRAVRMLHFVRRRGRRLTAAEDAFLAVGFEFLGRGRSNAGSGLDARSRRAEGRRARAGAAPAPHPHGTRAPAC